MNISGNSSKMRIKNKDNPPRSVELTTTLLQRGRQWNTTSARTEFGHLLDGAMTQPQVIVRRGKKYLVIETELLSNYAQPLSAAELVAHFRKLSLPPLSDFPSTKGNFSRVVLPDITGFSKLSKSRFGK